MKKKFLSVILTGAMVIGSCVVSFADNPTNTMGNATPTSTIETESQIQSPRISVALTLPTGENAKIKANPYKLTVGTGAAATEASLIGVDYTVKNESDCEILLSVKGSVSVAGATQIAAKKEAALTATKPTVFIQAFVKNLDGNKYLKVDSKTKGVEAATPGQDDPYGDATPLIYAKTAVAYTGNIIMERATKSGDTVTKAAQVKIEVTGATGGVGWAAAGTGTATADTDKFTAATVLDVAPSTSDANIKAIAVSQG